MVILRKFLFLSVLLASSALVNAYTGIIINDADKQISLSSYTKIFYGKKEMTILAGGFVIAGHTGELGYIGLSSKDKIWYKRQGLMSLTSSEVDSRRLSNLKDDDIAVVRIKKDAGYTVSTLGLDVGRGGLIKGGVIKEYSYGREGVRGLAGFKTEKEVEEFQVVDTAVEEIRRGIRDGLIPAAQQLGELAMAKTKGDAKKAYRRAKSYLAIVERNKNLMIFLKGRININIDTMFKNVDAKLKK